MEEENQQIGITLEGSMHVFDALIQAEHTATADVPKHKTEAEYSVSDNSILNPRNVSLKLMSLNDSLELDFLKNLFKSKKEFKLITESEVYERVVLTEMNYIDGPILNAKSVSLRIQEIITAKSESLNVSISEIIPAGEDEVPAASHATALAQDITGQNIPAIESTADEIEGMAG